VLAPRFLTYEIRFVAVRGVEQHTFDFSSLDVFETFAFTIPGDSAPLHINGIERLCLAMGRSPAANLTEFPA